MKVSDFNIDQLVTDGKVVLNKRYVNSKGILVENQTGLVTNSVDSLSAEGKYLVFITTQKPSKVQDAFGADFMYHVLDTVILKLTAEGKDPVIRVDLSDVKQEVAKGSSLTVISDSWSNPSAKVLDVGLSADGHPYADAEINKDVTYALGNVAAMMKNDIRVKLITRSQESTCLLPAAAVRGSGDSRYVYVGETESSTFGGTRMIARKTDVKVLAESGSTASVAEDLSWAKVLYMEDRALTDGCAVMEYAKESNQ